MKFYKRSLSGFQKIPSVQEFFYMKVYVWGYWALSVDKKHEDENPSIIGRARNAYRMWRAGRNE